MREKWKRGFFSMAVMFCLMFALSLSVSAAVDSEPNDTLASAVNMGLTDSVNGTITDDDADLYRLTVPANSSVKMNVTIISRMHWVYFKLYDGTGERLDTHNMYWNSSIQSVTNNYTYYLNPGTYYLAVEHDGSNTGSYTLSVNSEYLNNLDTTADDVIAEARPISLNSNFTGVLALEDEADIYKLSLTQTGELKANLTSYTYWIYYRLYDANGNELYKKNSAWDSNIQFGTEELIWNLEPGTYYLGITRDGSNYGKYTVKTTFTALSTNESERNDEIALADPISIGTTVNGVMTLGEESDIFRFTASRTGELTFRLQSWMNGTDVYVYDAAGERILNKYFYWKNNLKYSNDTFTLDTVSGRTYYIQISRNGSSLDDYGKYQLSITYPGTTPTVQKTKITSVSSISTKTCTGKAIRPSVTVKAGSKKLTKNKDYTISYANNIRPGRAKAVIRGKGNYTGTKTVYFYIKPAKARMISAKSTAKRKVTLKYRKMTGVSGYQIYYSTRKNSGYKRAKTTSRTTYTLRKTSKKVYYFKVRAYKKVGKKTLYGSFSTPKRVRIK